jgi:hypothetical protein
MYRNFIAKLHASTGCNANRELMADTLRLVDRSGGGDDLSDFLRAHHPDVIQENITPQQVQEDGDALNAHGVFEVYSPDIITYPRRVIFVGPKVDLIKKVQEFVADKLQHDHIIIDDRAYVEYLLRADSKIAKQIPDKNWQIATYRKNRI